MANISWKEKVAEGKKSMIYSWLEGVSLWSVGNRFTVYKKNHLILYIISTKD